MAYMRVSVFVVGSLLAGLPGCCLDVGEGPSTSTGGSQIAESSTGGTSAGGTSTSGTSTGQTSGGQSPVCFLDAGPVRLFICNTTPGVLLAPGGQASQCVSCSDAPGGDGGWPICYE